MFINEISRIRVLDTDFTETFKTLPSNVYDLVIERSFFGKNIYLKENDSYKKGAIIKTGIFQRVWDYVESFYSIEKEQARNVLRMKDKLGLMFNGLPGTGKTFLAGQIAQYFVEKENAIGILVNEGDIDFAGLVDSIRRHDLDRKVIIIIDEFEKNYDGRNSKLLSFLDGADSKENVIVIATTNNYTHLPDYLIDRPGRFEQIYNFDEKDNEVLRAMIKSMTPEKYRDRIDFDEIAKQLIDKLG
jgi:SpoVK/Ycf46/Vps4 family AAA+-type ATPase